MLVPGIGHEFHAYKRSKIALCATRTELRSLVMIFSHFHEVSVDTLDHHWVVVVARKGVVIDMEKVKCFMAKAIDLLSLSRTFV